jgi:hypothetical protein
MFKGGIFIYCLYLLRMVMNIELKDILFFTKTLLFGNEKCDIVHMKNKQKHMKKYLQKALAMLSITSILVSFFAILVVSISTTSSVQAQYNFHSADPVTALSTAYTKYAIATDGTMLKRVEFQGFIQDFIVEMNHNIAVFIPLDSFQFHNIFLFEPLEFSLFLSSSLELIKKDIYALLFFITLVTIFVYSWADKIASKRKSLLLALAKAHQHIQYLMGVFLRKYLCFI